MIIECLLLGLVLYPVICILYRKRQSPSYKGKTVWITGASSGIGEYLAYEFSKYGANLIISARNEEQLKRVKSKCHTPEKVQILAMNMMHFQPVKESTKQIIAELQAKGQGIDVLVENAGISMRCQFRNYAFQNHQHLFDLNVHAPFNHIQCCLEHMIARKTGQIVGVTSIAGKLSTAYRSSYAGSKHAFIGILDSLRTEFKQYGIKVCNLMPGYVKTNLSINAFASASGQKFGVTDKNIENGMDAQAFAREAVRGIYCEENEIEVSNMWFGTLGIVLRAVCPDLSFRMLLWNAKNQSTAVKEAQSSSTKKSQ